MKTANRLETFEAYLAAQPRKDSALPPAQRSSHIPSNNQWSDLVINYTDISWLEFLSCLAGL
jgi:hypothetical protein